jgi:hypothetical protein
MGDDQVGSKFYEDFLVEAVERLVFADDRLDGRVDLAGAETSGRRVPVRCGGTLAPGSQGDAGALFGECASPASSYLSDLGAPRQRWSADVLGCT